ncbi:MAG: YgiT-type zinc finger protein [Actinomycetota bacterium]|nr:YgiT-type zinc finger protein [Actinomycetota bacterium]
MVCERCEQGERLAVRRAKVAERDGKVAVVLEVPMEECPACGDRWLAWEVAGRLDELLNAMLSGDVEVITRHFEAADESAA